ncbi:HNH endonuclease [Mesorhizobium sanjuanii]|uniref:HNH endonuclease n=1 Tax=Mesorhizobium sanjuanii TaxID=2037900 RepID=UPI001AD80623|nr:HNH endonuclease [Mesorhizobium sanjuanii]
MRKAVALYVQTPFGKIHSGNPEIIQLALQIGRTPASVAYKLANLASLDETISQSGMSHASSLDREIWSEFFESLREESRQIVIEKRDSAGFSDEGTSVYLYENPGSLDRFGITKLRSRQGLFRTMVLSAYDFKCAVTGIEQPELLVAGHIKPWSVEIERRLDPRNGICLNRLHDRAFDLGLITFEADGRMLVSPHMKHESRSKITQMGDARLRMPRRFLPDQELLRYHRENRFLA